MILAILELQRDGSWNRMSLEALEAAGQLGRELGEPVEAAVVGDAPQARAARMWSVRHDALKEYTPDGYTAALEQLIRKTSPRLVLFPHTYQVRDFAPKLATRFRRALVSDCIGHRVEGGQVVFVRQFFQGKLNAEVRFTTDAPNFASVQAGAYRAGESAAEGGIEAFTPEIGADVVRTRPQEPFRESAKGVDLTAASVIVSVGRGIKDKDNLPVVEKLARALNAELAASRPICDNGWLPMERQVGSSGQTVAPKLYVAVGISGAIQHLVGMKGARTIVAINKDANAPIFEVADYGIVGDLFEVVPALVEEVEKARG
jgi:electron transfer flavoprotein alpha subunit